MTSNLQALHAPAVLSRANLLIRPAPLAFAPEIEDAIATHWQEERRRNPHLWNGSAFLFDRIAFDPDSRTLAAEGAATDFATFLHWRVNRDSYGLTHLFPVGAIVTADRKLVIGRMSAKTANPGRLYPPSGSFDAADLRENPDGSLTLDPDANILREIGEEIGIDSARLAAAPDLLLFPSRARAHALVRVLHLPEPSADVAPAMRRHLADDPHGELDDVLFVGLAERLDPAAAPPHVNELLAYLEANS